MRTPAILFLCPLACVCGMAWGAVEDAPAASDAAVADPPSARVLTLADALRFAHQQGRDKQNRDEELDLLAKSLRNTRWNYGPQPTGSLTAGIDGRGAAEPSKREGGTLAVSQSLPSGGTASISTSAGATQAPGLPPARTTGASASLRQPLLRGAGTLAWREGLTSAERGYVYSMRGYELFRQELTLSISSTFWALQGQQHALEQAKAAVVRAEFTFEQTRALMSIGKSNANDVFRAEVNLLAARQSLVDADAAFDAAVDALKFNLNLAQSERVAIDTAPPSGPRVSVDAAKAISEALDHRLDFMNAKDHVGDADRAVTLARRGMLPQLDLDAGVTYGAAGTTSWSNPVEGPPAYSVSVTLEIPFNRRTESLSYERAMIDRLRASRSLEEQRQAIIRDVLAAIRNLRSAEASLLIQDRNRLQSQRRSEKAYLDFKAGLISNRDLVEAQNEVRTGENAWFSALVAYRSAELRLRRETGTLVVRDDGSWSIELPAYATAEEDQRP
jgi:outer membrane protein